MTPKINPNPLARYFRKPAIYIRLPSNGDFWAPGTINMPENRELPVYPMTAADEITYRTPDALFNGQATVDVVQSCLPNITNAWGMPGLDLYSILIALRIASYGHEMNLDSTCPGCNETGQYGLDLRVVLENIGKPDYSQTARVDEVEVIFRPMTYKDQTEVAMMQFENNKMIEAINSSTVSDTEKVSQIAAVMRRLTDLQQKTLLVSIAAVRIPDMTITDRGHIEEWLKKCDLNVFATLRDHLMKFKGVSDPKPIPITCTECQHQYEQALEFDQTNFFVRAS